MVRYMDVRGPWPVQVEGVVAHEVRITRTQALKRLEVLHLMETDYSDVPKLVRVGRALETLGMPTADVQLLMRTFLRNR